MNLPTVESLQVGGKRVLVRADLDLPAGKAGVDEDFTRLESAKKTLDFLVQNKAKTIIIGHKDNPEGIRIDSLSLRAVSERLSEVLGIKVRFSAEIFGRNTDEAVKGLEAGEILVLENLRFDKGEEENTLEFARSLATFADFYVNEAFASSHRKHASIITLPAEIKSKSQNSVALGFHFKKEVEELEKVFDKVKRPIVFVLGGAKAKDKLDYIFKLLSKSDKILVGGLLPRLVEEEGHTFPKERVLVGKITFDGRDITMNTIQSFVAEIEKAGTIVWNGPLGRFEEEGFDQGTEMVAKAIGESPAFKVAGGGDTASAISKFNLKDKFDWISTGGGAMLEFLAKGTLPGIEALK